jgi:hypothetical protein
VTELRKSHKLDALEEIGKVRVAYAVFHEPASHGQYNAEVRTAEEEAEKKDECLPAKPPLFGQC